MNVNFQEITDLFQKICDVAYKNDYTLFIYGCEKEKNGEMSIRFSHGNPTTHDLYNFFNIATEVLLELNNNDKEIEASVISSLYDVLEAHRNKNLKKEKEKKKNHLTLIK